MYCSSSPVAAEVFPASNSSVALSAIVGSSLPKAENVTEVRFCDSTPCSQINRFPGRVVRGRDCATNLRPVAISSVTIAGSLVGICRTLPSVADVPQTTPSRSSVLQIREPSARFNAATVWFPIMTTRSGVTAAMA